MASVTAYPKHTNLIDGAEASISFSYALDDYAEKDLYTVFAKNAFDSIPDGSTINSIKFYFDAKYSKDSLSAQNYERWRIYRWLRVNGWDGTYNGFDSFNNLSKTKMYEGGLETDTIGTGYSSYTLDISGLISLSVSDLKAGVCIWLKARRKGTLNATMYIKNFRVVVDYTVPTFYLDLNGMLDGSSSGGISPYGTADIYINGALKESGVGDHYAAYAIGTTYEIKNIKANDGYRYDGVYSGSLSGTITAATSVVLSFSTRVPCTITYNGNGATSGSVLNQSGYVNESLALASNSFKKSATIALFSNNIFGSEYLEDEDALPSIASNASFIGWYTAAEGGTKVGDGGGSYTPTGNITLYANWSGYPTVTLPNPTTDGYTLSGWYTDRETGTKVGDGGASYTPVQKYIALFAQWRSNGVNMTWIGSKQPKFLLGVKPVLKIFKGTTVIYYNPFAG